MKYVLLFVFSLSLFAANIDCSDKSEMVRYQQIGYNKGVVPRPEDRIKTINIFLHSELISQSLYFAGAPSIIGPIESKLNKLKILEKEQLPYGHKERFLALLTLKQRKDSPQEVPDYPMQIEVNCSLSQFYYP